MNSKSIGVFDTGAGGLATVRELQRLMPKESIIYLGDTARAPYGSHSRGLIAQYAQRALQFLAGQPIKLLVSACGTVSTILPDSAAQKLGVPFLSLLVPCAQEACALSVQGAIGVIGTQAAIRSTAFARTVRNIRTDARVIGKACPLLNALAEAGVVQPENHLLRLAVKQYLEPLLREGIDTLILGSPSYSVLFSAISDVLGYDVTLVESASVTARHVQSYLVQNGLQNEEESRAPVWYVTDAPEDFKDQAKHYYGKELEQEVLQVTL